MADTGEIQLPFWLRIVKCAKENIGPSTSTIGFLLRIMLPVSFAVLILKNTGILNYIAKFMNPLMQFLGLPGEAVLVYLTSIFMDLYSVLAVINTLTLTGKQVIILSTMCLIAHSFFVECLIMKKTGSRIGKMVLLRISVSILSGWLLSFIVPEEAGTIIGTEASQFTEIPLGFNLALFLEGLEPWFIQSLVLVLQIFLIVFIVMFVQRILAEFGITKKLAKIARPIIGFFGLSSNTAYVWLVANIIGLAYGAGVIVEELKNGSLTHTEADIFNHHAAISHSQIEDTLLIVSLGVPYIWAALPRFLLAIIIVWLERVRRAIFRSSFKVKVV